MCENSVLKYEFPVLSGKEYLHVAYTYEINNHT